MTFDNMGEEMTTEQDLLRKQLELQEKHNKTMKRNMFTLRLFLACIAALFFLPMTGWFSSNGAETVEEEYTYDVYYEFYE